MMAFRFLSSLRKSVVSWRYIFPLFVDFQKAFDTVDHNVLIQKLNYYGVRRTANNWFSSYLENRTQFESINGYSSDHHFIHCGVP